MDFREVPTGILNIDKVAMNSWLFTMNAAQI